MEKKDLTPKHLILRYQAEYKNFRTMANESSTSLNGLARKMAITRKSNRQGARSLSFCGKRKNSKLCPQPYERLSQ